MMFNKKRNNRKRRQPRLALREQRNKKSSKTKRCKKITELEFERDFYFTAIDRLSDQVFWINPRNGSFLGVNNAACNLLGYSKEEFSNMKIIDLDPPGYPVRNWRELMQELKRTGLIRIESNHLSKKGEIIPVEISASYYSFKGIKYIVGIAKDISERKQAEGFLKDSFLKLEELVDERTIELKKALEEKELALEEYRALNIQVSEDALRLNSLNERLSDSEKTISKILSYITNRLRSSVASFVQIVEFLNLNMEDIAPETINGMVLSLDKAAKNAIELFNNFSLYEQLKQSDSRYILEREDLFSLIKNTIEDFNNFFIEKNITIKKEFFNIKDRTFLICPPAVLYVVRNLLSNALKFSYRGGIIFIRTRIQKDFLEIEISDNGIGIRPEDISNVFSFNINSVVLGTENEKGTGLGLFVCKEYLRKCGGDVSVFSEGENKGSSFYLKLPIYDETNRPDLKK